MKHLSSFALCMLDLDGLLVDTEHYHYEAYCKAAEEYRVDLGKTFAEYSQLALKSSDGLRKALSQLLPQLVEDASWKLFYQLKSKKLMELYDSKPVALMKGAQQLLIGLKKRNQPHCVVTNSSRVMVDKLCAKEPLLKAIEHWVTREDYGNAKPSGDCYLLAISRYLPQGCKAVGLEDSLRGVKALIEGGASAAFLVSSDKKMRQEALSLNKEIPVWCIDDLSFLPHF